MSPDPNPTRMVSRPTLAVALLALLAGVAIGGVGATLVPAEPFASPPVDDARLASFETVSTDCVDPTARDPDVPADRTIVAPNGSGADLTLRRNLTVAEPGAALSGRLDEIAPGTYALRMRTAGGDANATACAEGRAEARFVANLTFPDDDYTLLLFHDGEYVGSSYASHDAGPFSGGASGGASVAVGGASDAGSGDGGSDDGTDGSSGGGAADGAGGATTPANATATDASA